jgi:REP element-mobilizing transposase RayT
MNRGSGRATLFKDDRDNQTFIECVVEASRKTDIEIHGYCLMVNHFHLLVQSRSGRLSDFLRYLGGSYSRRHNARWRSDGPIFKARAMTVEATSDSQILEVSRYIHLNPVVAGLVDDPGAWRWSSGSCYLGSLPKPGWLQTTYILRMFSDVHGQTYESFLYEQRASKNVHDPGNVDV